MSIRKKMVLILLASAIIPLCLVGMLGYFHAGKTLKSLRMEELKSIADLKAKRIADFFEEHQKHLSIARQRPTLIKHMEILAQGSGDVSRLTDAEIKAELDRALKIYLPVYNFSDVILADPEGRIVYDLNRSDVRGRFGNSIKNLWGESFDERKTIVQYSHIFENAAAADKFSIYLMGPIRSLEGRLIGLAAFEISMDPIYELIQDTTGLGKTGETLIVKKEGDQALFLNPLRHDPEAALKRKVDFDKRQGRAIEQALKGHRGSGISVDYRGQEVIAAWRYIPAMDWGMVAKIDLAEAFEPVAILRNFGLALVMAVIVLSILAAFVVSKSLSNPIQALQQGVEEFGKGNLDHKVGTRARDEIGQLARAFDQMTDRLKKVTASRNELDAEINERKKVEKELQKSMRQVEERIKELNCLFEISRLVERRSLTLNEILQRIVELIPPAWRYPEDTCAKIIIKEQEFSTANFNETRWKLTQDIVVGDKKTGILAVYYLEEKAESDEGPFLKEERNLINAIAERIGRIIERDSVRTALVESEKRFRDLVEHSLTGISIIQDGQIVYQNPQQEKMLGPLPRPIKLQDTESIHPDDVAKVDEFYQNISTGNLPIGAIEFRFYRPDDMENRGHMKWVDCQASRIEFQGKEAMLMNMMDMTKTKELENLVTIQDKMASLGRVAAGIAHEIRNPLSGINIYLNTLKKLHHQEGSEEKVEQILQHLQSASMKIESVIRRVMDFSKPSEPKLSPTNINLPVEEAINLSAVSLRKRGIKIEKKLNDNLPLCHLDAQLIEQVILNLISNAAEAMKNTVGEKIIAVSSTVEKDRIQVKVADSGPGVPLNVREMIFDPFFTTKDGSSGIGLSLSHRIITDHGGTLSVSGSEWGGAEFRIEIPIDRNKSNE